MSLSRRLQIGCSNTVIDLELYEVILLISATIFTSGFAAVLGQGGGLILFALLAIYIDLPLLIAIHAVIQTSSNGSRALLAIKHVNWPVIRPIIVGTILGAIIITPVLGITNWQYMEPIMGLYILYITWGKSISFSFNIPFSLFGSGMLQGSLGMILGATGPLSNALLLAKGLGKHAIVSSNAVIMSVSHLMKMVLFSLLGISLSEHTLLLILLSAGAILGSFIGSHLRRKVPDTTFNILFKAILTLLCLKMVLSIVNL